MQTREVNSKESKECRTIDKPRSSNTIDIKNINGVFSNAIFQLANGDKKKGDDYVNNIGALFKKLGIDNISTNVATHLSIINQNRANCRSYNVIGEDLNLITYSYWVARFHNAIADVFVKIMRDDKPDAIHTSGLNLKQILVDLPSAAVDNRVTPEDTNAQAAINNALMALSNCFTRDYVNYLVGTVRGNDSEQIKLSGTVNPKIKSLYVDDKNNTLIEAIFVAVYNTKPTQDQYLNIRSKLVATGIAITQNLEFTSAVLSVIVDELGLSEIAIICGDDIYYNKNVSRQSDPLPDTIYEIHVDENGRFTPFAGS